METKRVLSSSSGSIDSISSLPDEILAQILSFLPIKRAASTTILSKRWKTLFPLRNHLCPSLCLDDSDLLYPKRQREKSSVVHDNGFRDFVDKTLSCCNNKTLKVLYASLDLDRIPSFMKLTTLHFESKSNEYWKLLCIMIEKSPNLESLVLKGLCGISDCGVHINGGNAVKVVEIQDYKGRLKELNQVKCFLWEMENLEEMKVSISDKTANKRQLTTDLLALPKRSSKCSIHVF